MACRQAVDDGWLHEVAVREVAVGQPASAGENLPAVLLRLRDRALVGLHRVFADDGAEIHVAIERVADLDLLGLLDEQPDELVAHRLVHVDARAGRAFLPLRAERRPHDAVARLVEVCGFHHERRVLPAHFDDQRPRHRARGVVADQMHPDFFRSGEDDAVDAGIVDELLAGRAAASGHEVERARRNASRDRDLMQLVRQERRGRCRLQHDRVPGDERAAGRTGGQRERKVERRDHRPHAVRPHHAGVVLARAERAEPGGEAVVLFHLIAVVLHQIGRLFDVADALEPALARFVSHERRELPAPRANAVGGFLHQRHALTPRARAPRGKRGPGRRNGVAHLLAAAALERAEQDARVDRAAIVELTRAAHGLPPDHHRIALAEGRLDVRDRRVELAMEIFHPVRGHRRVGDFGVSGFGFGSHGLCPRDR